MLNKQDSSDSLPKLGSIRRITHAMSSNFNKIANNLQLKKKPKNLEINEEIDNISSYEKFRFQADYFMQHSSMGNLYRQVVLWLCTLSCIQFIYSTYTDTRNPSNSYYQIFQSLELCIASILFFDWILHFILAQNKLKYSLGLYSIIDLLTVIPIYSTINIQCPNVDELQSVSSYIYYILCGINCFRILRALRFRKYFTAMDDEVSRALATMSLKIVLMILFNAAVMQYLEPAQELKFHTWTYFIIVTICTVGYGDITPATTAGRLFDMAVILSAIILIPQMTNDLLEKMGRSSIYARMSYEPTASDSTHVLICGDVKSSSYHEFFNELFHEDHDARDLHAVILQPNPPSFEMLTILNDPILSLSVTYLEGNALSEKDLKRAKAVKALAIFIMTNKFSANPDEEDAKTILQQFSIQRFLRLNSRDKSESRSLFCMQLIRPENKRHLVSSDTSSGTNLVVCLNEIKMGVIAKAVLFPGANTLIMNLLTSFADEKVSGVDYGNAAKNDEIEALDDDEDSDWIGEYQRGCDWEIYTTELANKFEGCKFCQLSEYLYQKLGIVLFALEIEDLRKDRNEARRLLLNPADYVIPSKEDFKIDAFVIAKNKSQSDLGQDTMTGLGGVVNFNQLSALAGGLANRMSLFNKLGVAVAPEQHGKYAEVPIKKEIKEKQAWQILLHKNDKISLESIQEELHKLEEEHLSENYYIRENHLNLSDAIIHTSVYEELPFLSNHIIIIGKALSNLYDLIRPLRAKNLGPLRHIIIIYPNDFPLVIWQKISRFESIWILRGSALEEADIRRAGIFKAKQVVVLADCSSESNQASSFSTIGSIGLDALVDADAIFCYQCVKRMNEQAHIVVEIVRHTNVSYLDPEAGLNSSDIDYKFTPQFASGVLFSTSLLDTLVCQAFYNTKILDVINKLISGVDDGAVKVDKAKVSNRQSIHNDGSSSPSSKLKSAAIGLIGSSLYQINIPDGLESRTYGSLYKLLAKRKQIPLGILRGVFANTKSGPKANKTPYVFTNPPKDTELFTCDKVFVLSQVPVGIKSMKDDMSELQMFTGGRRHQSTTENILEIVRDMKNEISKNESRNIAIETQLDHITSEMNKKFDHLLSMMTCLNGSNSSTSSRNLYHTQTVGRPSSGSRIPNRTFNVSDNSVSFVNNRPNSGSRNSGLNYAVNNKVRNMSPSGSRPLSATNSIRTSPVVKSSSITNSNRSPSGSRPVSATSSIRTSPVKSRMTQFRRPTIDNA